MDVIAFGGELTNTELLRALEDSAGGILPCCTEQTMPLFVHSGLVAALRRVEPAVVDALTRKVMSEKNRNRFAGLLLRPPASRPRAQPVHHWALARGRVRAAAVPDTVARRGPHRLQHARRVVRRAGGEGTLACRG
jgi:hypothetical protein